MSEGSADERGYKFEDDDDMHCEPLRLMCILLGGDPGWLVVRLGLPSTALLSVEQRLLLLPFLEFFDSHRLYSQRAELETQRSQPSLSPLHFNLEQC
jgi:hypothetical protein